MEIDYSNKWNTKITVKARGRGAGKTYQAARWLIEKAVEHPESRIGAVVLKQKREFFIEHLVNAAQEVGLNAVFSPAYRRIELSNDARIVLYSPDKPETLRGPSHDFIVGDNVESWDDLSYFYTRASVRPSGDFPPEVLMNFEGTESTRIMDLLGDGFEGTTG